MPGILLYEEETYHIRGACFAVWKKFGGAFKEAIVEKALVLELQNRGFDVQSQKAITIYYQDRKVGLYKPDLIVNEKILIELKAKPFITKEDQRQFWLYLQATPYKLGLLINFGPTKIDFYRRVYDKARQVPRVSASLSA